jgi:hypothetical protein
MKTLETNYFIVHAPIGSTITVDVPRKDATEKEEAKKILLCEILYFGRGEQAMNMDNAIEPECQCQWTQVYKMNMNKLLYYSHNNSFDELFARCPHVRTDGVFKFKCRFQTNGAECTFCSQRPTSLNNLRSNLKSHLSNVHHYHIPDGRSFRYKDNELRENN